MSQASFSFADVAVQSTNELLVRDAHGQYRVASADEILSQAWGVLAQRVKPGVTLSSPQDVKDYLRLEIGLLEYEVFCVVFLDAHHRVIELRQMFRGTVSQRSIASLTPIDSTTTSKCSQGVF
jgi:DNA repair protein RadC